MTTDPLPPLAEVFDDVFYRGRESERDDKGREYAAPRAKAVALAAPYDARIRELEAELDDTKARLASHREAIHLASDALGRHYPGFTLAQSITLRLRELDAENARLRAALTEAWQLGRVRGDQALVAVCARGLEVTK